MRNLIAGVGISVLLAAAAGAARGEVKTEEKNQIKWEGMMGRMMGMFGGKTAREGMINVVAVKGNRRMTTNELTGEIVDLDEQKVYELDMRKKSYEVVTFEEMRRRLLEGQEKAAKAAKESPGQGDSAKQQMEIDFSLKESGQNRNINGYDCREVVMTITARQKGKTLEEGGGNVMTSHLWLTPAIPGLKEIAEFERRYAEALKMPMALGSAEQMAMAMAMYPAMKDMLGKMQVENVKMDGTPVLTEMTTEVVKTADQVAQERKQGGESESITSIRSLGGLLGRKKGGDQKSRSTAEQTNRSTIMTMNHELVKVSASVAASDLALPAGFKEKK